MAIMSSAYFFYLKKHCKKLGKKPFSKDGGEGKRGLWRLPQGTCRHFKRKEFDLFYTFSFAILALVLNQNVAAFFGGQQGPCYLRWRNRRGNVGRRRRSDAKCSKEMDLRNHSVSWNFLGETTEETCVLVIWTAFFTFPECISKNKDFISSQKVTSAENMSEHLSSFKTTFPVPWRWALLLGFGRGLPAG